jgi:hypothetical protein
MMQDPGVNKNLLRAFGKGALRVSKALGVTDGILDILAAANYTKNQVIRLLKGP